LQACSAKSVAALHPYIRSFFTEEWPFAPAAKPRQILAPSNPASWETLVGIEDEKHRLLRYLDLSLKAVGSLPQSGLSVAPRKGVILVGPPGSGKTTLVRALASLRGMPLHTLDFASLLSADLGQAEANLRAAFRGMLRIKIEKDYCNSTNCISLVKWNRLR
jgi:SpoVK/Ycf46/Vps4 family AAA+-type ATPase